VAEPWEWYGRFKETKKEIKEETQRKWNFNVIEDRAEQMAQAGRKKCLKCGRIMCDCTLRERG